MSSGVEHIPIPQVPIAPIGLIDPIDSIDPIGPGPSDLLPALT